jgi:dCTP deaminase
MGVLADWQIEAEGIIRPFTNGQKLPGVITSGVSSYGYDVRVGHVFDVFTNVAVPDGVIDPKNFDQRFLARFDTTKPIDDKGTIRNYCLIPPNSFALCYTVEEVRIPRDVLGIVLGKSTYARCGLVVNCTPLEPEWRGHITMELSNTTPLAAKVYPGEGIAQILFLRADGILQGVIGELLGGLLPPGSPDEQRARLSELLRPYLCRTSYADKGGRYQDQGARVTMPFVLPGRPGENGP